MKRAALLAVLALAFGAAMAADAGVSVSKAWVRWLPGDLPAAGYATIRNSGATPIRLVGADSPDYAMVMLHRSVSRNGVERMVGVDGMDVPAHGSAALAPGGFHLMLTRPRHAVAPGDTVHLRLRFADGSTLQSGFIVRPASAQSSTD